MVLNMHTASYQAELCWSRSEITVLSGVGVGVGVGKILPTPTTARSRMIPTANRQLFRPNDYESSRKHWKIRRKGEWRCGDKVEATISDRIPSDKGYRR